MLPATVHEPQRVPAEDNQRAVGHADLRRIQREALAEQALRLGLEPQLDAFADLPFGQAGRHPSASVARVGIVDTQWLRAAGCRRR
jgi:hypothetical protein